MHIICKYEISFVTLYYQLSNSQFNTNTMKEFIKVSEAPKTKYQLKKAILNGTIEVYEADLNWDKEYKKIGNVNSLINMWDGFHYSIKYQGDGEKVVWACLGTSFYYKFKFTN